MITVKVNASLEKAWDCFTNPEHIVKWSFAGDDWHCPSASNDCRTGGKFSTRMEARDGSFGFDFEGIYAEVIPQKLIKYGLEDGRQVIIEFKNDGTETTVTESFDPETENPEEMQKAGWQMILDRYQKWAES